MARSRQRDRSARAPRGTGKGLGSQEALIYLATGVTVALAAAVILAGLYITRYRPPRAHVLTVQGERFNAADTVARGAYLITYQGQPLSADRLAPDTVTALLNEALFRLRGPALVGEVTAADVENAVRQRLGFPPLEPPADAAGAATAPPEASPGATGTPGAAATAAPTPTASASPTATAATTEATPTATATPDDREAFAKAYQDFLQLTQLSRNEFELIIRAELIEQRLQDQFGESIGESGPQKRLSRIRVTDPALADSIRQQLGEGADFVALHAEHSTGDEEGEGSDLGWAALDALPDETADAVRDLGVGEFSEVSVSGLSFDIFLVTEVSDDQPYDADTKSALVENQIAQWLEVEQARVTVERDLSDGEASWINEQILSRAQAIVAAASG